MVYVDEGRAEDNFTYIEKISAVGGLIAVALPVGFTWINSTEPRAKSVQTLPITRTGPNGNALILWKLIMMDIGEFDCPKHTLTGQPQPHQGIEPAFSDTR